MKGSPAWGSLKVARPSQVRRHKDRLRGRESEEESKLAESLNGLGCYYVKPEDECGCVASLTAKQRGAFVWCSGGSSDFHGHIIGLN